MKQTHFSRKQRQLKYLVKQLNKLLHKTDEDLKDEIKKMSAKIKYLVSQLNGIVSTNSMKRILGTVALIIGVSFTNTAHAQWFAYPLTTPFGIYEGEQVVETPTLADLDNDGDLDYLNADVSYVYGGGYNLELSYQENIGSANSPQFTTPTTNPFGIVTSQNPGSMLQFPKFVDLDGDGDFDILSAVVAQAGYYSHLTEFRYYENTGTPSNPQFASAVVNPFGLQSDTSIMHPTLCDIDNDGDLDIMAGNNQYYGQGNMSFIENIGSANSPSFAALQSSPFGLPNTLGLMLPTFTDLDNDGDFDMLHIDYGYSGAQFRYYENFGTQAQAQFSTATVNPFNLSLGNYDLNGILCFSDLDGDSDNDLILGTDDDEVLYFENVGIQQPVTYECINYSCVDPGTGNGTYTTLSACQTSCTPPVSFECDWPGNCYDPGDGSGFYATYADCMTDCTPPPTWDCVSPGNCQDPGNGSGNYYTLQDCQNDCAFPATWDCDATLGCIDPADGTGLYTTLAGCQANCNTTAVMNEALNELTIFPNPVDNILNISSDKKIDRIEIYDALGRIIISENYPTTNIDVKQLESGIYSIAILFGDEKVIKRFTK